jgi:hypothetical protein
MNAIEKRRIDEGYTGAMASPSAVSTGLESSKLEYIKQMLYQYLTCRDGDVKAHMETAIEAIFRFTPRERLAIEERRRESSIDTLSSITSFLSGGSAATTPSK